ncbi:hypothetical protein DBV39_04440 [Orrella marina]|uniref:Uncharacterized protein n=1 Tax=Orrella marina TaxID=2163011 RepID=A0A2R4XGY9_9BURK|nr:hypothetical protein DBV39_04440 [Orrella marina]
MRCTDYDGSPITSTDSALLTDHHGFHRAITTERPPLNGAPDTAWQPIPADCHRVPVGVTHELAGGRLQCMTGLKSTTRWRSFRGCTFTRSRVVFSEGLTICGSAYE